jgi:hypothetical protein
MQNNNSMSYNEMIEYTTDGWEAITNKDIVNTGPILGYVPTECSRSGTLIWESTDTNLVVYATPHWEDDNIVPIEYVCGDDDDYQRYHQYELNRLSTKQEQLELYRNHIESCIVSAAVKQY